MTSSTSLSTVSFVYAVGQAEEDVTEVGGAVVVLSGDGIFGDARVLAGAGPEKYPSLASERSAIVRRVIIGLESLFSL